ncbi:MAG TPA: sugar phosphate isomerase/epimerase family protein [Planctomycetota bacterium]|nr:sugar phosphate isomerase/epimerase family protein [Planctomycetota bacterium]
MPYRLSAFADEISPDIQLQMDHLLENGLSWCAMRGANNKNVMELEDFQINLTKTQFNNRGIKFSCIGSPVGKVLITTPLEPELERLKKAARIAKMFDTKVIRIFSFFMPKGEAPEKYRDEVLRRMKALADTAKAEGVNLLVENEKELYGDTAARQLEILEAINSPHVKAAFDFANFVQINDDTLAAWAKLKKYVVDIHVKDARASDGREVPAGEGDGKVREILKDAFSTGWSGYLSFEPHLSESGTFKGFTGPKLFKVAVDSLKKILVEVGAK